MSCKRSPLVRCLAALLAVAAAVGSMRCMAGDLPPAEREVLLDLFRRTDGANWENRDGWSTPDDEDTPPCTWHGVICDEHWQHVHKLVLDDNGLAGDLPPNLGVLSELRALSLRGNRLSGALPDLAGLGKLEYLELSRNQLTGRLPDLRGLAAMESFHVADNRLDGPLPALDAMPRVQFLVLANNRFEGPLPALAALRELKELSASGNRLGGPLPALAGLPLLHDVFLESNAFEGAIPPLENLPELRYLRLGNNRLTGRIPDLAGVPNLQELDVRGNRLDGPLPEPPPRIASARLCPNDLTHPSADERVDARWSAITKTTPWWRDCAKP
jgi:hypothetical protein